MERLFPCLEILSKEGDEEMHFFEVPDGTLVNPFFNPGDIMSGLPSDLLDGLSIAAGQINPGIISEIHVHPFISQVTLLLSGELTIWMKDPGNMDPKYGQQLVVPKPAEDGPGLTTIATLAPPGTFFQLDNGKGREPARVLYVTSPGYIFEPGPSIKGPPVYDDAITVGRDWNRLERFSWNPPELNSPATSIAARDRAIQRLASRSRSQNSD